MRSVPFAQIQVDLEHVDHFLANESAQRRKRVGLQDLSNFRMDLRGIALRICCPFRGDPIELVFGVVERDMRIKAGARSREHVAGDI